MIEALETETWIIQSPICFQASELPSSELQVNNKYISGNLGKPIAAELGLANSSLIMPLSLNHHYRHSENIR